jgi:acyl-CoA synthetase (AMP-forming)/AMP-acid ligase II
MTTDMATVDQLATHGAARRPDRAAIVVPGRGALTYGELDRRVSAFAQTLHERGAAAGDRLVLANGNTPEMLVALLGAARAGLIAVPIDSGLTATELANVLAHVRPHAVVVDAASARVFAPLGAALLEVSADAPVREAPTPTVASEMPALILYTSGTTGTPRGAVHSHAGILAKVRAIASWFRLGDGDSALCMLPTHFGHGLVCSCLTTLSYGGTLVLCRPFDLELLPRVFALADEYGVTTFSSVPTIVRLLLRNAAIAPPRAGRLAFVTCASAPLHPEEIAGFESRFGVPLLNCYGLTEAGTWSAMSPNTPDRDRRSIGTAAGCRMRAVSTDNADVPLPPGEIGELQIAGPSVMLGYRDDPEATARVLRNGWLATGDLGSVDDAGRVFLAGRIKDLIIRAGANIYPAEVERRLLAHPEVAEAYVVGIEHAILGEQVVACVVRRPATTVSDRDLVQFCREVLATYKCPERIVFVDAVEKTSRGKVNRAALRALLGNHSR